MDGAVDYDQVARLIAALEKEQVQYAVVGGVALNIHAIARATQDIDIFIAPSDENVARLKRALRSVWDDPEIDTISASDFRGDYPAIQYVSPDGKLPLDILARLGEAFRFEDIAAEMMTFRGSPIRVATAQMLYDMKKDTVRPQDKADAAILRERFGCKG